jgi:FlaA1/EpsC-like NDP-sugar epimerase
MREFKGKTILVTGGTGSIGSEIVRQLLRYQPKAIRVFARHEERHHALMHEIGISDKRLRFIVGDVRDKERVLMATEGVDIVFHAAALKHVALCEYNPFEAVKTNVLGTQNIIEAARELGVKKVVGISTDKVAEPEGILGVSKLMAEKLFLASYYYKGNKETKFACVRFGNVLGSRGSIVPLLKRQIEQAQEVTITEPDMTRFVMSIPQAVKLVLDAVRLMRGQEIFVLKMPAVRLADLVRAVIFYFAPLYKRKPTDIRVKIVGKRAGEKMHETLLAGHEIAHALETKQMYILTPQVVERIDAYREKYPTAMKANKMGTYRSEQARRLSREELNALIAVADQHLH